MKKIWAACKRHEVMVKLVKYSLCILDFPWRNIESRTLESRIRNPGGWNPESKGLESGIQRPGSGIQDLHGFSFMGLRWLQSHYAWLKWARSSWIMHQNAVNVLFFSNSVVTWTFEYVFYEFRARFLDKAFLRFFEQGTETCLIGGTKSPKSGTGSRLIGMNFMSAKSLKNILL